MKAPASLLNVLFVLSLYLHTSTSKHLGHNAPPQYAEVRSATALLPASNSLTLSRSLHAGEANGLSPRQTKKEFPDLVTAGVCMLSELKDKTGTQSGYTTYTDLAQSGWQETKFPDRTRMVHIPEVLAAMKWNVNDFVPVEWMYLQPWIIHGPRGGGSYRIYVNTKAGVIVATDVEAPVDPIVSTDKRWPLPKMNPPLRRLSDYIFLIHQKLCNDDAACLKRLEWIIHVDIINDDTYEVIQRIQRPQAYQSGPPQQPQRRDHAFQWPGITVKPDKPSAKIIDQAAVATVGCPNGYGVAFLLSQHTADSQYGHKVVDYVNVFQSNVLSDCMAWHIADADDDDDSEGGVPIGK